MQLASIINCSPEQLLKPQQHPERVAERITDRTCNWYLPPFENPFYGGVMTILRLAESLQRQGLKQRFLICGGADRAVIQAHLGCAFPALANADVVVLDNAEALHNIPAADYSVATLWTTAYVLLAVDNTGLKFYMIQDFEPAFYPAGSTYAQTELTYHFGFYGICNTLTLKEIYERDYGGCAVVLQPSIDKSVFFAPNDLKPASPKRLFYYARPGTPRNGFELAAAALTQLKHRYGDGVDIVCAGTGWSPEQYGLDNVVRTVGMLPYTETGDLYRSCHAGFVMMMTKHPSYLPFELMACGATVVTNYNPANAWLLKDGVNCLLSPPSASCLAATLAYALDHHEALAPVRQAAANQVNHELTDWDTSLRTVSDFMFDPPAAFAARSPFGQRFLASNH
ncbi:MAG: glycosyltransferase family 4 protein [Pseudomonadota bacterium]|nr:glycosyltransferase family 4 protein [Pseudomonadota bacterium]MDQ3159771.1 glycosyltransferase family 4 protein [Pseudomonadota bacterium]